MAARVAGRVLRRTLLGWALIGCGSQAVAAATEQPLASYPVGVQIIVAVRDVPEARPAVGGSPHAPYGGGAGYAGSTRALAEAERVAADHGLIEESAWTITPLRWRCMLYRLQPGADQAAVLAALASDPRVQLAEPLHTYETLATPYNRPYNDPYVELQRGFAAVDAADAQRWTQGAGVRVALIDTGVDSAHPDLQDRVLRSRDFVPMERKPEAGGERHGTEMAGVIAAGANNRVGIVGIAPLADLLLYRACWPVAPHDGASRCDAYTLAQALAAAIEAGADVINLSLGGPADPLLRRLAETAMRHGTLIVGAVPPSGRMDGFPVGVPGVLAVAAAGDATVAAGVLVAPGTDILTLTPGGHYDYVSGSSLAAAHVTGALALLRALDSHLNAETARLWLSRPDGSVDVCAAVRRLRTEARCASADSAPAPAAGL